MLYSCSCQQDIQPFDVLVLFIMKNNKNRHGKAIFDCVFTVTKAEWVKNTACVECSHDLQVQMVNLSC